MFKQQTNISLYPTCNYGRKHPEGAYDRRAYNMPHTKTTFNNKAATALARQHGVDRTTIIYHLKRYGNLDRLGKTTGVVGHSAEARAKITASKIKHTYCGYNLIEWAQMLDKPRYTIEHHFAKHGHFDKIRGLSAEAKKVLENAKL